MTEVERYPLDEVAENSNASYQSNEQLSIDNAIQLESIAHSLSQRRSISRKNGTVPPDISELDDFGLYRLSLDHPILTPEEEFNLTRIFRHYQKEIHLILSPDRPERGKTNIPETEMTELEAGNIVKLTPTKEESPLIDPKTLDTDTQLKLRELEEKKQQVRNLIAEHNMKLVVNVAKKYRNKGLSLIDMCSAGNLGLMRAIESYDPDLGYRFSTYATWWIRQSITRTIHNESRTIRLPVHLSEFSSKVHRTQYSLAMRLGREPSIEEIADHLGESAEKIQKTYDASDTSDPKSLDIHVTNDRQSSTLSELIPDPVHIEDETKVSLLKHELAPILDRLPERHRRVLELRFGLEDGHQRTLEEVGNEFGLTRERIRQLERNALKSLRLQVEHLRDYLD